MAVRPVRKRSLLMIKSTLRRSIRRAQVHDLIGRNVVELIDLPSGQPGLPSRAMTQDQAAKVLRTASGNGTGYVKVAMCSDKTVRNYLAAVAWPPPSTGSTPASATRPSPSMNTRVIR